MNPPRFDGPDYDPELDGARLTGQILRVFACMDGAGYLTLEEIQQRTRDPQASISAQLRHLRKERFGGHTIDKRRRGKPTSGCWEYRLTVRPKPRRDPVQMDMIGLPAFVRTRT